MRNKTWAIRNYRAEDFDDYVQLHIGTAKRDQAGHSVSRQSIADALGHPSFDPHNDLFLAEEEQNLIGSVSVFLEPGIGRALLEGGVHPDHRRKGVATDLFEHAVTQAKAAGLKSAQISVPETSLAAKQLLHAMGLTYFRCFIGYRLDITARHIPQIESGGYWRGQGDILHGVRTGSQTAGFSDQA